MKRLPIASSAGIRTAPQGSVIAFGGDDFRLKKLLTIHPFDGHANGVEVFAGGDEKCVAVFAAETDVSGPRFLDIDMLDLFAGGVEDGDTLASKVNITLVVDGHAIRAEFAEELFVLERAIGLDLIAIGFPRADVGHVKDFAVGSADDAVRLLKVFDDANEFLVISRQEINALVLFFGAAFPVIAFVVGVGEVEAAARTNPDVIGSIEKFALIVGDDDGRFAGRRNPPKFVFFVRAGPQVTLSIKGEPIGATAGLHEGGEFAVCAPFENAVVGLISEENVSFGVASGTFSETEIASEFLESFAWSDDFAIRSDNSGDCKEEKKD